MSTKFSNLGGGRNPSEMLAHVARGEIDDEIRAWLAAGAAAFSREDRRIPLDRLLGLPRGKKARLLQRDFWLRQAFSLCPDAMPPLSKAVFLAGEIAKFRREFTRAMRPADLIDKSELSDLRIALRRAFGQGCRIPESPKQLLRIGTDKFAPEMSVKCAYGEVVMADVSPKIAGK